MAYDIVIGRNKKDLEKFGSNGTIFIGKSYVKMGQTTSLSNNVFMDVVRAHAVFICGKRGGGKSYTLGVVAEGVSDLPKEISQNLSIILLDTMGIYWTMKYPNRKDEKILNDWGLKSKPLDISIFTPFGVFDEYKKKGIPTDIPFSIRPDELDAGDWCLTFDIGANEPMGILLGRVVEKAKELGRSYSVDELIKFSEQDEHAQKDVKDAVVNLFMNAKSWGLFSKDGTPLTALSQGGRVTVLDVSCYSAMPNSWGVKALVVGLVSKKLFIHRMVARREEEFADIHKAMHYFSDNTETRQQLPLIWLVIDEAHEFIPNTGKTAASDPIITILREGRQPGISCILATQQPGKIHTDVMTQSDIVLSHRLTAKLDIDSLGSLMQSYMRDGLNVMIDDLPRTTGAALIFDDSNERMYPIQIRPRFTWHGGESPSAYHPKDKKFDF